MDTKLTPEMKESSHPLKCSTCGATVPKTENHCLNCGGQDFYILCNNTEKAIPEIKGVEFCPCCGERL